MQLSFQSGVHCNIPDNNKEAETWIQVCRRLARGCHSLNWVPGKSWESQGGWLTILPIECWLTYKHMPYAQYTYGTAESFTCFFFYSQEKLWWSSHFERQLQKLMGKRASRPTPKLLPSWNPQTSHRWQQNERPSIQHERWELLMSANVKRAKWKANICFKNFQNCEEERKHVCATPASLQDKLGISTTSGWPLLYFHLWNELNVFAIEGRRWAEELHSKHLTYTRTTCPKHWLIRIYIVPTWNMTAM